jgi:DNA modification methylase
MANPMQALERALDTIVCGDCLDILSTIPDQSVDAVIADPPYPHIRRDYGYWTAEEWWALIVEGVVPEVRRILKPSGSAVFILQPNSEKVGKMRGWLWEFMAWVCREWNMVQDAYWWNFSAIPSAGATQLDMMRPSIKICVWAGDSDCYRNQSAVLWGESWWTWARRQSDRASGIADDRKHSPSGHSIKLLARHLASERNGGVTPFNLLPFDNDGKVKQKGGYGHSAGTPLALMDWWLRYIVPPDGLVVDPFMGSGTTAVAAIKQRKHFFGCDCVPEYVDIANKRIEETRQEMAQLELAL